MPKKRAVREGAPQATQTATGGEDDGQRANDAPTKDVGRRASGEENVVPPNFPPDDARRKMTTFAHTQMCPEIVDIDKKHETNPSFAAAVAKNLYGFLHELEKTKLKGDGQVMKAAVQNGSLALNRVRIINWLFEMTASFKLLSNTIHLTMFYLDRFFEKYTGPKPQLLTIATTALILASKFDDVEPVYISDVMRTVPATRRHKLSLREVLALEVEFLEILKDFIAPTATAFAHRYLQAVDMELNLAAAHTARYLCALAISHFPFTGEFYSKLAAAAVFITFNKYAPSSSTGKCEIEYPTLLEHHCGYTLDELKPIVLELVDLACKVEAAAATRGFDRTTLPIAIYAHYKKVAVVTTKAFPDFQKFFRKPSVPATSEDKKEPASKDADAEDPPVTV